MNSDTGAIAIFEKKSDAEKAGFDVKLSNDEFLKLKGMSSRERRNWLEDRNGNHQRSLQISGRKRMIKRRKKKAEAAKQKKRQRATA